MIVEHALLPVRPGQEAEFEAAFDRGQHIIAAQHGFVSLQLSRGIEQPSQYLLLVEWESLADHDPGFRQSDGYQEWRRLLHPFYEPFPDVAHFQPVRHRPPSTPRPTA